MNQLDEMNSIPAFTGKNSIWVPMSSWKHQTTSLPATKIHSSVRKITVNLTWLSKAIWIYARIYAPITRTASHLTTARTVYSATWETLILTQPRNSTNQPTNLTFTSASWQRNWHCFQSNPCTYWARINKDTWTASLTKQLRECSVPGSTFMTRWLDRNPWNSHPVLLNCPTSKQ